MSEIKLMPVLNIYSGEYEDLVCSFEIFLSKGKLKGASIESITSKAGFDLMPYLEPDGIPHALEQKFMEEW